MNDEVLRLHLEPDRPIEVAELVGTLSSLAHQFRNFVESEGLPVGDDGARLLIASVTPGSIDINFVPDAVSTAAVLSPVIPHLELIRKFADHIKWLLDGFSVGKKKHDQAEVSIKDCDDAVNIVRPTANNGGNQQIQIINGDVNLTVLRIDAAEARNVLNSAALTKARMQTKNADTYQRVPLVWTRVDRNSLKKSGSSPDKAKIEDIDPQAKAVLFTDEMASLKEEMIKDEDNVFRNIYFVDVQASRVDGRIVSYRVVGYHGKEPLE